MKPFQLIGVKGTAPNPFKVAMVIEELGLPWEFVSIGAMHDVKGELFLKFNPNGRVPALVDPNKDNIIIWESGAIIEYLIETYDTAHTISSDTFAGKWQERTLLHFQMSGQGPYFGQAVWFLKYHGEKIPSAADRYLNEADRVTMVLDNMIRQNGGAYLTGEKLSYVDVALAPWFRMFGKIYDVERPGFDKEKKEMYVHWAKWWDVMSARPSVKKFLDLQDKGDYSVLGEKTLEDLAKEIGL